MLNITLKQVETFVWLAALKSFRRVGEQMHTTFEVVIYASTRLCEPLEAKAVLYKIREFGIGRPRAPRRPVRIDGLQILDGGSGVAAVPLELAVTGIPADLDPGEDPDDEPDDGSDDVPDDEPDSGLDVIGGAAIALGAEDDACI